MSKPVFIDKMITNLGLVMQQGVRQEFWTELLTIIESYLEQNNDEATPVLEYHNAVDLKKELDLKLEDHGQGFNEIIGEIKKYLKYSVRTSHPQFNNQLSGGFNFEAMAGELISFIGNATMATFEVAPVASLIEDHIIKEINKIIGFDKGDGIMVTGGSNANMLAIHCARSEKFPDIKSKGNQGLDLCIFVSDEAHYSHKKAMMLLGLGLDNLILVKSLNSYSFNFNTKLK